MKGNGRRELEVGSRVKVREDGRTGSIYDIDENTRPLRFLINLDDGGREWIDLDEIEEA